MSTTAKIGPPSLGNHAGADRLSPLPVAAETVPDESWSAAAKENSDWLASTAMSAQHAIERHYVEGVSALGGVVDKTAPKKDWFRRGTQ